MAWDHYEVEQLKLISGDATFDTLRGALQKLRREYLERHGRPPYLAELVYTLCRLPDASQGLVEDASLPLVKDVLSAFTSPTPTDHIDPGEYEAGFDEESEDVCIGLRPSGDTVVRATITRDEGVVNVSYSVLSPDLSDAAARCLIRSCGVNWLLGIDIRDENLVIHFERRETPRT